MKRYESDPDGEMFENLDGEWVKFEEANALIGLLRLQKGLLLAENEDLHAQVDKANAGLRALNQSLEIPS